jgi:RNA polymerase sporulation-specific sigma factor
MYETNVKKTDEELVKLAKTGDKRATEELLLRHAGLVRGCARGFFPIGGETEDLIQEGMIGLYNAIGEYKEAEENSSFKNFAYLCVTRRIIDAVKTSARKKNSPLNTATPIGVLGSSEEISGGLNPEDALILQDDRREFRQKMSGVLSDFEFKVTTMYMDGMSCGEICEATGKSAKSVDNALQRSKRKLQEVLR